MPRTLITGGAGFIGSHLCDFLLEKGHEVICVDNLITASTKNITHLKTKINFTYVNHDVTKPIKIEGKLDYVLHLASPASPIDFDKIPIQIAKVGSLGTHNALGLAKDKKAIFLFASTSEIYGDPLVNPQPETYFGNVNPIGIRSCYDESKRFGEALTMAYHRKHKIDTKIVRIFNTYGPRMRVDDGRAVPTFINQALKNEPITVFGNGKQTRSFCYISDLIEGIYKLMISDVNEPINIGNPDEYTILELAKKIIKLTKSRSEIVFKELPQDDPKVRRPDIAKANELLNWQPRVSLEKGLKNTIGFFKEKQ
jgi:dTDP-glucose 4,6-dehydratase